MDYRLQLKSKPAENYPMNQPPAGGETTPDASVWSGVATTYNRIRLYAAVLCAILTLVVGTINGWPRPALLVLVTLPAIAHAVWVSRRGVRSSLTILAIDAVSITAATTAIGLPRVTLLALAFLMVVAAVMEGGRRLALLWILDGLLAGAAHFISIWLDLAPYTPEQASSIETAGLVFFGAATVALVGILTSHLRQSEDRHNKAELEIYSRERRFSAMLAHSSDGIAIIDNKLRIVELGVQNERLTGYPASERTGESILDLLFPEDRSIIASAYERARLQIGATDRFRVRLRRKDGQLRVMDCVINNALDNPVINGFIFNFHDVTQEHLASEALLAANERLEELVRSKDEFVASVSHELRTPLTAVVGMAELISDGGHELDDVERQEFLSILVSQARQTASIVEDLLVAARAEIGQVTIRPEPCDLADVVTNVLRLTRDRDRVEINIPSDASALADPIRLQQIVRNLVTNAERHGGRLVSISAETSDGHITLCVSDDGLGVTDTDSERIFEPYQRAYEAVTLPGSIGLGLFVSRVLARMMGGDLRYRRTNDLTVFELSLPLAPVSLPQAAAAITAR